MDIALNTLRSISTAIISPEWIILFVLLALYLHGRNKKTVNMQKMIMGNGINSALELTLSQVVVGIVAGVIASIILSYLGVMFNENSSIEFLFIISLIMMFFNTRLVCFSYAGGILGAVSLVTELLYKYSGGILKYSDVSYMIVDISALMTLVAVLHFVEGILVMIDGDKGYIPVFSKRDDKIVGGFTFQRYWALPIALMIILSAAQVKGPVEQMANPGWWPLLHIPFSAAQLEKMVVDISPFIGVIGYSSSTFSMERKYKKIVSGEFILAYSLILFILAQLASYFYIFSIIAVVFAPAGHEAMMRIQRNIDLKKEPKYVSDEEGIMILDIAPGSPAEEMGIKSGDKLIEINNKSIEKEEEIVTRIHEHSNFLWLKVKKASGEYKDLEYTKLNPQSRLGIVYVPRNLPGEGKVIKVDETKFREILEKLKNKQDNGRDN